jgi:hypothetical protein
MSADVLLEALARWAEVATESLEVRGAKPYRAVLAAEDDYGYAAEAQFGALVSENVWHYRPARAEVVLGSDAQSSSRFSSGRVVATAVLPIEDVPLAIDRDLWLATDTSFKSAVKQFELKKAALSQLATSWPPDRVGGMPVIEAVPGEGHPLPADALRSLAVEGSKVFARFPELQTGSVSVWTGDGRYVLATSDGTRVTEPAGYATIRAWCEVQREDGLVVWDDQQWVVRTAADLPSIDAVRTSLRALAVEVVARASADVVQYYEGPVVFEGDAASELLSQLAIPEIEGTPPAPEGQRTWEQLTRSGPRIGRHLLPEGWTLADDPGDSPLFPPFDREGVPTLPVELVRDGVVVDLLMTEVARQELQGSNGHARGDILGSWSAVPTAWTATPDRAISAGKFDKLVERARTEANLDRVLVVRSLGTAGAGSVPAPNDAVWRLADGTEVPVAALEFQRADRRILRDISAASGEWSRAYLASSTGLGEAGTRGLPVVATTPDRLLVTELEAVFPGGSREPHVVPMPQLAR